MRQQIQAGIRIIDQHFHIFALHAKIFTIGIVIGACFLPQIHAQLVTQPCIIRIQAV